MDLCGADGEISLVYSARKADALHNVHCEEYTARATM
jgi:hypothetical protein